MTLINLKKNNCEKIELTDSQNSTPDEISDNLNTQKITVYIAVFLTCLLVLGILLFCILFYPLTSKISGEWEADGGYMLSSQGDKWRLKVENFQEIDGFDLVYSGTWQTAFPNKYTGVTENMTLEADKTVLTEADLVKIREKNDLYTILNETDQIITLLYTEKGILAMSPTNQSSIIIPFSLESLSVSKKNRKLVMNSREFSDNRLIFKLSYR